MMDATRVCGLIHEGPHMLALDHVTGGPTSTYRVATALKHVLDSFSEDFFDDLAPGERDIAAAVIDRTRAGTTGDPAARGVPYVAVNDEEWTALSRVVDEAADYMDVNHYADDDPDEFPEDVQAARVLSYGKLVTGCCAPSLLNRLAGAGHL